MKPINWNPVKNKQLMAECGISFEDVVFYLRQGELLDDVEHPNKTKYLNQRMFIINLNNDVYLMPYIETRNEIFLKTIIPSRKTTKLYL